VRRVPGGANRLSALMRGARGTESGAGGEPGECKGGERGHGGARWEESII